MPATRVRARAPQGRPLELRELPIAERLEAARPLKEAGNEHFRAGEYSPAIEQYEGALGSFKYAKQLDPDWKKKGIRDETIQLIDERGKTDDERRGVAEFEVSLYNNLAAAYLARAALDPEPGNSAEADYKLCVQACTAALELDPQCAKALYRRARALTEPIAAGEAAAADAIRDLAAAARHAPDDRAIRSLLNKLRKERSAHKTEVKGRMQGMFDRGEIYDASSLERQASREAAEREMQSEAEKGRTVDDCEAEAREADTIIKSLREQGRHEDAAALELKVSDHRRQLDEYRAQQRAHTEARARSDPRNVDWRNPTPEQAPRYAPRFPPRRISAVHLGAFPRRISRRSPTRRSTGSTCTIRASSTSSSGYRRRNPPN